MTGAHAQRTLPCHGRKTEVIQDIYRLSAGPHLEYSSEGAPADIAESYTTAATAGRSSHVRPSSSRPPAFGVRPPHCLKKKSTPALTH